MLTLDRWVIICSLFIQCKIAYTNKIHVSIIYMMVSFTGSLLYLWKNNDKRQFPDVFAYPSISGIITSLIGFIVDLHNVYYIYHIEQNSLYIFIFLLNLCIGVVYSYYLDKALHGHTKNAKTIINIMRTHIKFGINVDDVCKSVSFFFTDFLITSMMLEYK